MRLTKFSGPIVNFYVVKKVYAKKFLNTIVQYGIKQQLPIQKNNKHILRYFWFDKMTKA